MSNAIETAEVTTDKPRKFPLSIPGDLFDLATHDGIVTIHNPATGGHRTFRIQTARTPGKWEGMRFVAILIGPDNTSDYQNFGTVVTETVHPGEIGSDGQVNAGDSDIVRARVSVKPNYSGDGKTTSQTIMRKFAKMLENPPKFMEKGIHYHISGHCRRCGRVLTRPDSLATGVGPECAKKA
jgi:hypothetical protein